jgi:hypothetical protein
MQPEGTQQSERDVQKLNQKMSKQRHQEIAQSVPKGANQWSEYPMQELEPRQRKSS